MPEIVPVPNAEVSTRKSLPLTGSPSSIGERQVNCCDSGVVSDIMGQTQRCTEKKPSSLC